MPSQMSVAHAEVVMILDPDAQVEWLAAHTEIDPPLHSELTVREDAERLGVNVVEMSHIEHGREPETEEGRKALEVRAKETEQVVFISHNNNLYAVDLHGDGEAKAEYVKWHTSGHSHVYTFKLSGAHTGPGIEVLMINPQPDYDEGGFSVEWEKLYYADDGKPFDDDVFLDTYTDALGDEMKKVISETWS